MWQGAGRAVEVALCLWSSLGMLLLVPLRTTLPWPPRPLYGLMMPLKIASCGYCFPSLSVPGHSICRVASHLDSLLVIIISCQAAVLRSLFSRSLFSLGAGCLHPLTRLLPRDATLSLRHRAVVALPRTCPLPQTQKKRRGCRTIGCNAARGLEGLLPATDRWPPAKAKKVKAPPPLPTRLPARPTSRLILPSPRLLTRSHGPLWKPRRRVSTRRAAPLLFYPPSRSFLIPVCVFAAATCRATAGAQARISRLSLPVLPVRTPGLVSLPFARNPRGRLARRDSEHQASGCAGAEIACKNATYTAEPGG